MFETRKNANMLQNRFLRKKIQMTVPVDVEKRQILT